MIQSLQDFIQYVKDQPDSASETLGQHIETLFQYNTENQYSLVKWMLESDIQKRVDILKQDLQARKSMPNVDYRALLEESLNDAVVKLKENKNWKLIRTTPTEKIIEILARETRLYLIEQRISIDLGIYNEQKNFTKKFINSSGNWGRFFLRVIEKIDLYGDALVASEYIMHLQNELALVPVQTSTVVSRDVEQSDFTDYLLDNKDKLRPFLIKYFTGRKPQDFAVMLFALKDLGLLNESVFNNKTELHRSLEKTFGDVGTRASLNHNINHLNSASNIEEKKILRSRTLIMNVLK